MVLVFCVENFDPSRVFVWVGQEIRIYLFRWPLSFSALLREKFILYPDLWCSLFHPWLSHMCLDMFLNLLFCLAFWIMTEHHTGMPLAVQCILVFSNASSLTTLAFYCWWTLWKAISCHFQHELYSKIVLF